MLKPIVLAAAILFAAPGVGLARQWLDFGIEQSRFSFEVPPGFDLDQRAKDGQAATFKGPEGAFLAIYGAPLPKSAFKAQIRSQMMQDEADGWRLTYKRVTPNWASYSGIKDGKIRYFRAIVVCGDRAAVFQIDYRRDRKLPYDPIVVRMVRALKPSGC